MNYNNSFCVKNISLFDFRQYTRNIQGLEAQRDNRRNQLTSDINQAYNQIPSLGSVLLNVATSGLNSYASLLPN